MTAKGSFKRAVWCRWAHRYRAPKSARPVVSRDPGSPAALVMTAGPGRDICGACEDSGPGWPSQRIMDRFLAS